MSQAIPSVLFKQGFVSLAAAVKAGRPEAEIKASFRRLRRLHAETAFATAREKVEAGRALGTLRLLWMVSPRPARAKAA